MIDWGTDFASTTTGYTYTFIGNFTTPLTLIIGVGVGLGILGFFIYTLLKPR